MKITITIECDNDAFQPTPERELGRILRRLAGDLDHFTERYVVLDDMKLRDINGNTVGIVKVTDFRLRSHEG